MTEEQLRRLSPSHPAVVAYFNAKQAARRARVQDPTVLGVVVPRGPAAQHPDAGKKG